MSDMDIDGELSLDLLHNFMISLNMTGDISGDLESYEGEAEVRYTNPFFDEKTSDDFWHVPLISIGDVTDNGNFCRISAQHTNPSTLYIAFRPLNLDGVKDILKTNSYFDIVNKFMKMKKLDYKKKSIDNLIHTTHSVDSSELIDGYRVSSFIVNDIMNEKHTLTVENAFVTLGRNKEFKKHISDVLKNQHIFTDSTDKIRFGDTKSNISFFNAIVSFINAYKPTKVVFCGYSFGSSLAAVSSYLVHRYFHDTVNRRITHSIEHRKTAEIPLSTSSISNDIQSTIDQIRDLRIGGASTTKKSTKKAKASVIVKEKPIEIVTTKFCLYQFAGPKVGSIVMKNYIDHHFDKAYYIALRRDRDIDPVSYFPVLPKFVHIGQVIEIDVLKHSIRKIYDFEKQLLQNKKSCNSMTKICLNFVMGVKDSFKSIHLAGEDLIERILLKHIMEQGIDNPYVDESIGCEYFTETGYSAKYKVCPKDICSLETSVVNKKILNKCVSK